MTAYLIARFDMTDPAAAPAAYKAYAAEAAPAYAAHGARFLVRGGAFHAMEGAARSRNVVIAYADLAAARACYRSDAYQAARQHRLPVATGEIVIAEGLDEPPPETGGNRAYWIARQDVHDPETYKKYVAGAADVFAQYGAHFLVRGGAAEALEGEARARNVLIAFPSLKHAQDCYHSDAYRAAGDDRRAASTGEIVIVEGA